MEKKSFLEIYIQIFEEQDTLFLKVKKATVSTSGAHYKVHFWGVTVYPLLQMRLL
jgi:hypothetical protein